ncbi:MAG: PKD domain-containing protein [Flavobacteriales bacterium]|tara:strand:+ start:10103 stop:11005 length:903 start_codon:yes stop_codon:yes gene_type:complete
MKKLNFLYFVFIAAFLVSCESSDSNENNIDESIIVDFTFTNTDSFFQFTNLSKGATSYRWDFGDLSFYCEEENPTYRYVTVGGEVDVTLTAISDSGKQNSITKTIQAPEVIDVEIKIDGNFTEWDALDFIYTEEDGTSVQKIKIWGKGDNVSVYLEGNTKMKMEIVDIFINSDGNSSTGFLSWQWPEGSGADFLFEGPLLSASWGAFYQHTDPNGGWSWAALAGSAANMKSSGIVSIDADTNAIEFSIPKTQFGTLGETIGFSFSEKTIGWAAVGDFPKVSGTSKFVEYEFPIESLGVCQ